MKSSAFLFALLMLVCAGTALASDLDGKWVGKMQGPNGESDLTFTFKVSGDSLTGSVAGPMGEMPISNGKVKDNTFSFDVSMGDMVISHDCTLEGDTVKMKFTGFGGDAMAMDLKRVVSEK